MKGFCPGKESVQQGLEEGKIEAWYMGQGKLLERCRVHRTAATMGAGSYEQAFCTTDSCKRMYDRNLQAVNFLFVCMLSPYCYGVCTREKPYSRAIYP